jgi:hypothetical protein
VTPDVGDIRRRNVCREKLTENNKESTLVGPFYVYEMLFIIFANKTCQRNVNICNLMATYIGSLITVKLLCASVLNSVKLSYRFWVHFTNRRSCHVFSFVRSGNAHP